MSWRTHLVLAEMARQGARVWCADPAAAPLATDLAGARCICTDVIQRVTATQDHVRRVMQLGPDASGTTGGWDIAIGPCGPAAADILLYPPSGRDLSGYAPAHAEIPDLWLSARAGEAFGAFAADLAFGMLDDFDWAQEHLIGASRVRALSLSVEGALALDLDPLSALVPISPAAARQAAFDGEIRLSTGQGATRLRLPTFDVPLASFTVEVESAGTVMTQAEHGAVASTRQGHSSTQITLSPAQGTPWGLSWVDLAVKAHAGRVTGIRVQLMHPRVSAFDTGPDGLDQYGDPLASYPEAQAK